MEIFKNYKNNITPTCLKEIIEKRNNKIKTVDDNKEKMIKEPKFDAEQAQQPNQSDLVLRATEPYPKIVNAMPNRVDVKQLKMLTTGRNGELTAVLTYLYQHYILNEMNPDLAKDLEQISLVEMEHYELLSEAIVDFGGDPNLTNGQGDIWTGRNIDTTKEVKRMLKNDIKSEKMAIADYNRAAKDTRNESLAELYLRIAKDEALHIVVLKYFLDMM